MAKHGKQILFVGSIGLIVHFKQWVKRPMGDLVRALFYLEEDWKTCFEDGQCDNQLLGMFLRTPEEQARFKQYVMWILPQAEKAGRVVYFKHTENSPAADRAWTRGLNELISAHEFNPIPPSGFQHDGPIEELKRFNPDLEVIA